MIDCTTAVVGVIIPAWKLHDHSVVIPHHSLFYSSLGIHKESNCNHCHTTYPSNGNSSKQQQFDSGSSCGGLEWIMWLEA